jgi:Methyltransferase FkbM domain
MKKYFKSIKYVFRFVDVQAYVFGGCLSTYKHPAMLAFKAASDQGGLQDHLGALDNDIKNYHSFESLDYVYCVPLNDLLAALNVKHVDYFSLDVQGAELPILETIDFTSVQIDIIIAEAANGPNAAALRKFFNKTGIYKEANSQSSMDIMMEHINLK